MVNTIMTSTIIEQKLLYISIVDVVKIDFTKKILLAYHLQFSYLHLLWKLLPLLLRHSLVGYNGGLPLS